MARLFVAAQASRLDSTIPPVTLPPYTVAAWVRLASNPSIGRIFTLWNSGGNDVSAVYYSAGSPGQFNHFNYTAGVDTYATCTASAVGAWAHVCITIDQFNNRYIYSNGVGVSGPGGSQVCAAFNRFTIGANFNASQFFDGDIAEVTVWNIALTAADVAMLALAPSALLVRPDKLVAHWPLLGYASPDIDLIGRRDLTITNAVPSAHPRLFMLPDQPTIALSKWGAPLGAAGHTLLRFGPEHVELPAAGFMTHAIRNGHRVLEAQTGDGAIFSGVMPRIYKGGRITVMLHWMAR